jgi:hypothetical protein
VDRVYLEIFSKTRDLFWKFVDCGLVVEIGRGLNEKVAGVFGF